MKERVQPSVANRTTTYTVKVDDNFHYQDESERYTLGEYDTWEEALAVAQKIVDDYLNDECKPGAAAEELYDSYVKFGEDPFIVGGPPEGSESFSAWDYAKKRCEEICGGASSGLTPDRRLRR